MITSCMIDLDTGLRKYQNIDYDIFKLHVFDVHKLSHLVNFQGTLCDRDNGASTFLEKLEMHFTNNNKIATNRIQVKLISMITKKKGNIREYILKMFQLIIKLKL